VNNFELVKGEGRLYSMLMRKVIIQIEGMRTLDCAVRVQRALISVPTVRGVYFALGQATVELEMDSDKALLQAIRAAGNFTPVPAVSPQSRPAYSRREKQFFGASQTCGLDQPILKPLKEAA